MERRTLLAAVVAAFFAVTAYASEPAPKRDPESSRPERVLSLRALFDRAPGVVTEDANGLTAGSTSVDVIVARIDTDGKLVKACVNSEEAARRFLEAPVEKVDGRRNREQ